VPFPGKWIHQNQKIQNQHFFPTFLGKRKSVNVLCPIGYDRPTKEPIFFSRRKKSRHGKKIRTIVRYTFYCGKAAQGCQIFLGETYQNVEKYTK
jgi:hypothetical protein